MSGDGSRQLWALAAAVVLALGAAVVSTTFVARSLDSASVQGIEIDLAVRQRDLSESIGIHVERLVTDPTNESISNALLADLDEFGVIRVGLLGGDAGLGLDGRIPEVVRDLFGSERDLSRRLGQFENAARAIALGDASATGPRGSAVRAELDGDLVDDLDQVVTSLVFEQDREAAALRTATRVGLFLLAPLVALAGFVLVVATRQTRRLIDTSNGMAEQLSSSEAIYRTTVDSLVDGVVIQKLDGSVDRVNHAARRIIRSVMGDATPQPGQTFGDFLPDLLDLAGEPLPAEERPIRRALSSGEPVVGQVVGMRSPAGLLWFRCNASVATGGGSSGSERVVLTFADITAERLLASRLQEEERRFRLALEHAPIGMALMSTEGRFLMVNQALCDLTGRSRFELLDTPFLDLAHPDDVHDNAMSLATILDGGVDVTRTESRFFTPDGRPVHVMLAVSMVRPDLGGDPYLIVEMLDVTEQRRAERAQRDALEREREMVGKLQDLDVVKTNFVSTVSHELRTPLTSMIGYLELLTDEAVGPLLDRQHEMLGVVTRNGERLLGLIEDLLTIVTFDEGGSDMERQHVDVEDLVATVVMGMMPIAEKAGVALRSDVEGAPPLLQGDRTQLDRVLLNIVGNAVKFTPAGGTVCVRAALTADGDHVEFSVSDTGIGIREDEQELVFSRFFRTAQAYTDQVPGSGLGLAIAAELVGAHDGSICLESTENVGTTVTVRLPCSVGAGAEQPGVRV